MNHGPALAALVALLGACSPAPQQSPSGDEPRPAVAAMADPVEQEPDPVLDAEGNELDPELADAVREKMAEQGAPEPDADPDADTAE